MDGYGELDVNKTWFYYSLIHDGAVVKQILHGEDPCHNPESRMVSTESDRDPGEQVDDFVPGEKPRKTGLTQGKILFFRSDFYKCLNVMSLRVEAVPRRKEVKQMKRKQMKRKQMKRKQMKRQQSDDSPALFSI